MTEPLASLLTRLSDVGGEAILWGRQAKPYFGKPFDRLLNRGVLIERKPDATWSVCRDCECGIDDRPIERIGGQLVAVCPIDRNSDTVLEPEDLRTFRVDRAALVREIAASASFDLDPPEIMEGVWFLGHLPSGRAIFVVLSTSSIARDGFSARLRDVARGAPCVVVAPELPASESIRLFDAGVHVVPLTDALRDVGPEPLCLDRTALEPRLRAPRLQIERTARQVVVDGTVIRVSEQQFSLLCFLAEHALASPAPVTTRQIEDHLWGAGIHRMATQAKEPIRALRAALGDPSMIESTRNPNGYRLRLDSSDIAMRV